MVQSSTLVAAAAAALVSLVSANSYSAYPTCRVAGERCIGAPGRDAVPWIPCCAGMTCSGDDKTPGGYGKVCSKEVLPTCRKAGERCIGADGYPAVPWVTCCDGASCSKKDDSHGGYGMLCDGGGGYGQGHEAPKCYKSGERCRGADNHPAVPWLGCCNAYETCDTPAKDWGYVCGKPYAPPPPPPPPPAPKCGEKGASCGSYNDAGCCGYSGLECIKDSYGQGKCGYKAPPPQVCAKKGEACSDYMKCCGYSGLTCTKQGYTDKYTCEMVKATMAPTTTTTTTTTAKCLAVGEKCGDYYGITCCAKSECKKVKTAYGVFEEKCAPIKY
jgi:hypothetical protein